MKQLSFALLIVLGLVFFIPIKFHFLFSALYFIVHLALVWGFRMKGVISDPVKHRPLLAGVLVLAPLLYLVGSTFTAYYSSDLSFKDVLVRHALMLGVIVLQYGMLVVLLKKPLLDRY